MSARQADVGTGPVLFLGGLGRSGTTLLERMLGELPGVASLGEVVHLWERALRDDEKCGCGEAFSACPFWTRVGERAFGGWDTLDADEVVDLKHRVDRTRFLPRLALPVLRPSVRRDLRAYLDLYERVYAAAREVSGAAAVVDSSKHVSLAYCLRWSRRADLQVLHVLRDSPAVAYSWSRAVVRPEADDPEELMPQYSLLRVAVRWNVDNLMYDLLSLLGTRRRIVRYEALVDDPREVLAPIAADAGVTVGEGDLGFLTEGGALLRTTHTVAGNPMRFRSGALVVRRDDAWRTRMRRRDRRLMAALTAPVRARYGYGVRGRAA